MAEARSAGASPKSNVTSNASAKLNASSRQPVSRISRTGSPGTRSMDVTSGADHEANSPPSAEALTASNALSTSTSWTRRSRPAPIRDAQCHLACAGRSLCCQQIRDIGAGNQENQGDQKAEDEQRAAVLFLKSGRPRGRGQQVDLLAEEGLDDLLWCVGVKFLQALPVFMGESGLQGLPNLLWRDSRFGTYPHAKPGPAWAIDRLGVHHGRDEDVGHLAGLRSDEALWRHADDLEAVLPHAERLSDYAGVATEAARPVVVAQDGHRMRAGCEIVTRCEQAAESRLESEDAKQVTGDN